MLAIILLAISIRWSIKRVYATIFFLLSFSFPPFIWFYLIQLDYGDISFDDRIFIDSREANTQAPHSQLDRYKVNGILMGNTPFKVCMCNVDCMQCNANILLLISCLPVLHVLGGYTN